MHVGRSSSRLPRGLFETSDGHIICLAFFSKVAVHNGLAVATADSWTGEVCHRSVTTRDGKRRMDSHLRRKLPAAANRDVDHVPWNLLPGRYLHWSRITFNFFRSS